jgi:multiple sugar transport system ATP-binding protein
MFAELPGGQVPLAPEVGAAVRAAGLTEVVIGVRPEDLSFAAPGDERGIDANVTVVESLGHERHVICRLVDQQIVIVRQDAHEAAPQEGSATRLVTAPGAIHLFDPESGARVEHGEA